MPLKVDLHIHTKEDIEDRISYSAYELIELMCTGGSLIKPVLDGRL